nr:NADH pyrophosphatase zinc ribbon domain-containing protein [Geotalea toluenoxydans]
MQTLHWERNSAVCSRCGGSLQRIENTWGKRCQSCAYEHFPHISLCHSAGEAWRSISPGAEKRLARGTLQPHCRFPRFRRIPGGMRPS